MHNENETSGQQTAGYKKKEVALKGAAEWFKVITNSTPDAIIISNSGRKIIYWNKAAEKIFGYKEDAVVGQPTSILSPKWVQKQRVKDFAKLLEADISDVMGKTFESVAIRKGGAEFPVEISHSFLVVEAETYFTSIIRDITNRKNTEKSLRESLHRLNLFFENANDGILIANGNTKKLFTGNKKICRMLGYSLEELKNLHVEDLHTEGDLPHIMEQFEKQLRNEITIAKDIRVKTRAGNIFYADITSSQIMIDGKIHALGVFRDITEKKKCEKAVEKAHNELEKKVGERTAELRITNKQLKQREKELEIKTESLLELNTTLRVLIGRRGEESDAVEKKILLNVKELVTPYIKKIKGMNLKPDQMAYLNIVESNLNDILSPLLQTISAQFINLTPTEIKVANLIRQGNSTKNIAQLMSLSKRTIDFYRENIRKKLNLKDRKTNLRTYLMSLR